MFHMKTIRVAYGLLSLLFLIMGMCIYLLFRDFSNIALFAWILEPPFPVTPSLSCSYRCSPPSLNTPLISLNTGTMILGRLFVFNLPHGLWSLSGLLAIRAIWLTNVKWRAVYGVIFLAVISALEISQLS